jgi:hypothetical protein
MWQKRMALDLRHIADHLQAELASIQNALEHLVHAQRQVEEVVKVGTGRTLFHQSRAMLTPKAEQAPGHSSS